jgi:hypothetical protein
MRGRMRFVSITGTRRVTTRLKTITFIKNTSSQHFTQPFHWLQSNPSPSQTDFVLFRIRNASVCLIYCSFICYRTRGGLWSVRGNLPAFPGAISTPREPPSSRVRFE